MLVTVTCFLALTTLPGDEYDVVVAGGTPAGIMAAVAASRGNAKVVLLEPTRHVGGLTTSGLNTAEGSHLNLETFSGLCLEFYRRLGKKYGRTNLVRSSAKHRRYRPQDLCFSNDRFGTFESHTSERTFNEMLREANVEVRFAVAVERVEKEGPRIRRVFMTDGSQLAGRVFIDATYEGDLMARAGVTYRVGRENRDEYGESLAGVRLLDAPIDVSPYDDAGGLLPGVELGAGLEPGSGDRRVINYNYRLVVTDREDNRVPFSKPRDYDPKCYRILARYLEKHPKTALRELIDFYERPNGKWELNNRQNAIISIGHFGGNVGYPDGTYEERKRIREDHKDYTEGFVWFLGHDPSVPERLRKETLRWGLAKDEFADNGHWPYYLYVREGRRMVGAAVVTQKDIDLDREKVDAIALGSHYIDSHHVRRVAVSKTQFANEGRIWVKGKTYEVPYRSLIPKADECTNLLVPVCVSFSRVAFCSVRVEPTWMMLGESAGTAAAVAAQSGAKVQDLDVRTLQLRLRNAGLRINLDDIPPIR